MKGINLKSVVPLIPAVDLERTVSFYTQQLEFENHIKDGEPLTYAGVKKDSIELHLYQTTDQHLCDWSVIRLQVTNIEGLYQKYQHQEFLHPNGKLELKSYGLKEFSILDPNGVLLTFFERP